MACKRRRLACSRRQLPGNRPLLARYRHQVPSRLRGKCSGMVLLSFFFGPGDVLLHAHADRWRLFNIDAYSNSKHLGPQLQHRIFFCPAPDLDLAASCSLFAVCCLVAPNWPAQPRVGANLGVQQVSTSDVDTRSYLLAFVNLGIVRVSLKFSSCSIRDQGA